MRSTGADEAGVQNVLDNRERRSGYCCHTAVIGSFAGESITALMRNFA